MAQVLSLRGCCVLLLLALSAAPRFQAEGKGAPVAVGASKKGKPATLPGPAGKGKGKGAGAGAGKGKGAGTGTPAGTGKGKGKGPSPKGGKIPSKAQGPSASGKGKGTGKTTPKKAPQTPKGTGTSPKPGKVPKKPTPSVKSPSPPVPVPSPPPAIKSSPPVSASPSPPPPLAPLVPGSPGYWWPRFSAMIRNWNVYNQFLSRAQYCGFNQYATGYLGKFNVTLLVADDSAWIATKTAQISIIFHLMQFGTIYGYYTAQDLNAMPVGSSLPTTLGSNGKNRQYIYKVPKGLAGMPKDNRGITITHPNIYSEVAPNGIAWIVHGVSAVLSPLIISP